MADPVIPNVVRAQCIWKGPSNLPTDRYVTTWAFVRASDGFANGQRQSEEVSERLREFWVEPTVGSPALATFIANNVRTLGLEIRTYDLGQPTSPGDERIPTVYQIATNTMTGANATNLPREVAVTASFYADRNVPTRRGRVYIGPLNMGAMATNENAIVGDSLMAALRKSMRRLSSAGMGAGDNMQWGVLSQKLQTINPATNGWVDNAFDTIRSRGQDASARVLWDQAGPAFQ